MLQTRQGDHCIPIQSINITASNTGGIPLSLLLLLLSPSLPPPPPLPPTTTTTMTRLLLLLMMMMEGIHLCSRLMVCQVIHSYLHADSMSKSVKCYCGRRPICCIPSTSGIQSQMGYQCVQYTMHHFTWLPSVATKSAFLSMLFFL